MPVGFILHLAQVIRGAFQPASPGLAQPRGGGLPAGAGRPAPGTRDRDMLPPRGGALSILPVKTRDMDSSPSPRGDLSTSTVPGPHLRVVNSEQLLQAAEARLKAAEKAQIWALHIQAGAVTLIVGTTSAGKTTFLHNLAYHLAAGEEF